MATTLQKIFGFDASDLAANRDNCLTERQKSALAEKLKETRGRSSFFGLLIIGIFGFLIVGTLTNPLMKTIGNLQSGGEVDADMIALLAVLGLLFLILIGVAFGFIKQMRQKPDHTIRCAEGTVNFTYVERRVKTNTGSGSRTVRSLEMRVGTETRFTDMDDRLPNLINQGEEWVIYSTSYPFMFLSAEKIGEGK